MCFLTKGSVQSCSIFHNLHLHPSIFTVKRGSFYQVIYGGSVVVAGNNYKEYRRISLIPRATEFGRIPGFTHNLQSPRAIGLENGSVRVQRPTYLSTFQFSFLTVFGF